MSTATAMRTTALLAAALAAAGPASAQQAPGAVTHLSFTITDSVLRGPTTFAAGVVTLSLTNRGRRPQIMQLVRIGPGHTIQDARDRLHANQRMPSWTAPVIGVGPVDPGRTVSLTVILDPTDYMLADLLPTDGAPNYLAGVSAPLHGTGTPVTRWPSIEAAGGLLVTDRSFRFGSMIRSGNTWTQAEGTSRLTAIMSGTRKIRIDAGLAGTSHDIILARGGPEVMRDYAAWLAGRRPVPPPLFGGIQGMPNGQKAYLEVALPIGPYVLFCARRHARYGTLGFESGEYAQFVVR